MKKLLMLAAILTLVFASCSTDDEKDDGNGNNSGNNSDVIGIWTARYGTGNAGEVKLDIANSTWVLVFTDPNGTMVSLNGTWARNGNTLTLLRSGYSSSATVSLSGGKLILNQSWNTSYSRPGTCELTKSGSTGGTGGTTLKINNQSFTEITDVIWNNVTFANNQYENSIKPSTNVTNTVQAGGGYIFFKRKSNPITARTKDMVVIENGEKIEFTFTDNTVIVEVNNPNNNGTLGALQSTVVWWDDAEGEMQPYYEARSFVGYYKDYRDLDSNSHSDYFQYHPVKNGNNSIAIGRTATAMLHLKINLARKAKLSFWYANKYYVTSGTTFSINGVTKRSWTTDVNWSFIEFDLEAGLNDLIWEKKDGASNYYYYYLSLDDILIYYTE